MPIKYHESSKTFHLFNEQVSYVMRIMDNGQLENVYYGYPLKDRDDFSYLCPVVSRSAMVKGIGNISLEYVKQEYSSFGTGDFRSPAFSLVNVNGSRISCFEYQGHHIFSGKNNILPLPATFVNDDKDASSLEIYLYDPLAKTKLTLSYTLFEHLPVISRHAKFTYCGHQQVILERALSLNVDFSDMDFEMVQLSGAWARERHVKNRPLQMGIQAITNLHGTGSSAEHNPFIALKRRDTNEFQGEVYGFSLVYSGNFISQVEVTPFELTRVTMGIHPECFSWPLKGGESFQTPEAIMVYSHEGLNHMSHSFHTLFKEHLLRGEWASKERPILLNNWEATYFDFDEDKILTIASKAKEVGVELFVLDDGWFATRNDDRHGLGDWFVNTEKLPNGISGLSRKINEMGLKFGLWVELEMVNKDSQLYQNHPDWLIGETGRFESYARNQYVLDFSRKEVVDYIDDAISKVIGSANIDYIKWDMNRYMSEPFSRGLEASEQGTFMHRYILGVYDLYTRLTTKFPNILFESCASGGSRFDPGMLYFAPQTWTSDDTDAYERLKIQYGTSYVYPLITMGSHVSAVPNHQVKRNTPLSSRSNIAYFGTFGYELDLNLLSEKEIEEVKAQILWMKKYRHLIQIDGLFYRLLSPFENQDGAWMVVSKNQKQALACYYQGMCNANGKFKRLYLKGLKEDFIYTVRSNKQEFQAYGVELMHAGIPIELDKEGDFASCLFEITSNS